MNRAVITEQDLAPSAGRPRWPLLALVAAVALLVGVGAGHWMLAPADRASPEAAALQAAQSDLARLQREVDRQRAAAALARSQRDRARRSLARAERTARAEQAARAARAAAAPAPVQRAAPRTQPAPRSAPPATKRPSPPQAAPADGAFREKLAGG